MSEAARLRELQGMALRLAAATTDDAARRKLEAMAEEYAVQLAALERAAEDPKDEPPLPAT
jgi:hypothetical protein